MVCNTAVALRHFRLAQQCLAGWLEVLVRSLISSRCPASTKVPLPRRAAATRLRSINSSRCPVRSRNIISISSSSMDRLTTSNTRSSTRQGRSLPLRRRRSWDPLLLGALGRRLRVQ